MNPAIQRLMFPLAAPRWLTLAFLPVHVLAAAVDGYAATHRAVLRIVE